MTLKEIVKEVKNWSTAEQSEFCSRLSLNITICIRSVLSYGDEKESEKLEAIKWLNEFHHRMINLKFEVEMTKSADDQIEKIGSNADYYASKNSLVKGEIAAIIKSSFTATKRNF